MLLPPPYRRARSRDERFRLIQPSRQGILADNLKPAVSFLARLRGLMFRSHIPGEGLLFKPGGSFHTAFVRFPIDALFLDRQGRILKLCHAVPPWQIRLAPRRTAILIELPAGTLARWALQEGDVVVPEPSGDLR
jgi:uncharacterized membrane protein (UPF0127 family)